MISWFQTRSYPKHQAQKEMSKVRFNKENSNAEQSKSKGVIYCYITPLVKIFSEFD